MVTSILSFGAFAPFAGAATTLVFYRYCELAAIRGDIVQLRTLLKGARAGDHLRLDVLWGVQKGPESGTRPTSYSLACMQEVTIIKESVADMKKLAADLYAEQCGQSCAPQ